uniref:Uncharacterized protein n=1 Tax=Romanomermis culicivorax TaxID=13658 RepID=A0A915JD58_ROMCU
MNKFVSFIDSLPRLRNDHNFSASKKRGRKIADDNKISNNSNVNNSIISENDGNRINLVTKCTTTTTSSNKENFLPWKKEHQQQHHQNRLPFICRIGRRRNTVPENYLGDRETLSTFKPHNMKSFVNVDTPTMEHFSQSYTFAKECDHNDQKQQQKQLSTSMICSLSRRPKIRTNPWMCSGGKCGAGADFHMLQTSISKSEDSSDMLYDSSVSSGYGSHDSSPASSVHSPDWKVATAEVVNRNDEPRKSKSVIVPELTDIGLQCSMTDDKSVYCDENDFIYIDDDEGDPDEDKNDRGSKIDPSKITMTTTTIKNDQMEIFERKMREFRQKTDQMTAQVQVIKEEYERHMRDKQLCQEQMFFVRRLKLVIHNGCEGVSV